ncbi:MAG: alpha/beta hydrolase [Bacteroidales bacterium]|jgi:acetyl esterase/lipase|nr:alpha/beta hydrolase [Bacteroidales bacterium]MCI2145175.1 alpha/beta hydrolase [Bacteroidales bacterium]
MKRISSIFKSSLTLLFLIATLFGAGAQNPVELKLWPNGSAGSNGLTGDEMVSEDGIISNVTNPSIIVFRPSKPNGIAIIMCPGGSYIRLAINHEGYDMASWFNALGVTYIILKYRMPNGHPEIPLSDAEQAMRVVRAHAAEWGVDPHRVGIMGASAGGHLAASLATLFTSDETRPDFQILLYPVISMSPDSTHAVSRRELIGGNASKELEIKYSLERQVSSTTPQAFIALSADDKTVPPSNGISYFSALLGCDVPATLHVYPFGRHGWGFRDSFKYKRQWTGELEKWLFDGVEWSD